MASVLSIQYLYSLPAEQLAHIVLSCLVTFGSGIFFLGALLMYMHVQDKKEERAEKKEHTIIYGVKETAVTIQHQDLNKDDEEFLRHVRALSNPSLTESECLEILDNFGAFLKLHEHPNARDIRLARKAIWTIGYLESAIQWLQVAQAFWILHPWEVMIPYIVLEHEEASVDNEEAAETTETTETAAEAAAAPSPVPA